MSDDDKVPGTQINHVHVDGRRCIVGPDGLWRHWEESQGPLDSVERVCGRPHPPLAERQVDISGPEPVKDATYGMPAGLIAGSLRIGDRTIWQDPHDNAEASDAFRVWIDDDGVHRRYGEVGNDTLPSTEDAAYILKVLPKIVEDFLENNSKYARAQTGHDLGLKGIIPDINRKTSALITRIWDEAEYGRDTTDELIGDLIGHLLLMLAKTRGDDE